MSLAIVGLQRTGTNYLQRVILDSFGRDSLGDVSWKHALPREVNPSTLSSARVILNIRHPIMWFQSCVSNGAADILETRPGYFSGRRQIEGYADLYNDFYISWKKHIERLKGTIAKYEDLINGNFSTLTPLAAEMGREIGEIRTDIPWVPYSVELSGDDLDRHRRMECHLPKTVALEFWQRLDLSLVGHFDYDVDKVIFTDDVGVRTLAYRLLRRPWVVSDDDLNRVLSASTQIFAQNCLILQAAGRQVAERFGDFGKALELYEAALLASEREREVDGVYADFNALGVIDDIRAILPKIPSSDLGQLTDASALSYEEKYHQLHATIVGIFENTVAADSDADVAVASRCRDLVQLGDLLQRAGRLDEAETMLNRAIALDHSCVAAHTLRGEILLRQDRLEDAEASLREAIRNAPEEGRLRAALSEVLRRQGKIDAALAEACEAIHSADPVPWWFHQHACLALSVGKLDDALESLKAALRSEPNNGNHLLVLADVQQRQGRLDEAEESLRQAIRFAPRNGMLRFALSELLARQGETADALGEAAWAIVCPEPDPRWFHHHAQLAARVGRLEEAVRSLRTALQAEPGHCGHLVALAEVQQRQGRTDEAADNLRLAIELSPHDGRPHFALSDVLQGQGRVSEALDEAALAIRCDDPDPWWFHHHACLALRAGRLSSASESLQMALRAEPDNREHHFVLADVLQREGRLHEAANSLRRAIQIRVHDGPSHFVLSDLLARQGRMDEALDEAAAAIECPEAEPWWFHHHARLASRLGALDLAEKSLVRALESEPNNPRHLFSLATVLLRSNPPRAIRVALRAIGLELSGRLAQGRARR